MRNYESQGQTIEVELRFFPVFLWLAGGFVVRVGGREFWPKPTHFSLTTATEFDFDSNGRRVSGVVRAIGRVRFPSRMHYAVVVDDTELARDEMSFRHWYLSYFAWGMLLVFILLAFVGLLHIFGLA
jgi:hypothetical protein